MAKDAYYFPHDCHAQDDEKILDIRAEFGWEGYGLYWAIIERMRAAKDYKLSCDKLKSLAMVLGIEYAHFMKFIALAFKVKLFVKHNKMYYSESLLRRMEKVDAKRDQARKAAEKRWTKEPASDADAMLTDMRTHSGRNATGNANKSKSNKIKQDQSKLSDQKDSLEEEIRIDFWKKKILKECSIVLETLKLKHSSKNINWDKELDKWNTYLESEKKSPNTKNALFHSFKKWIEYSEEKKPTKKEEVEFETE